MILSGGEHPQLPGPQVSETKHNTAVSFQKKKHHCIQEQMF